MIEIPFCNDFYSIVSPENKNEIIEHCLNAVELPEQEFEWGEHCLSEKVHLKLTGFSDLLKTNIIETLSEIIDVRYAYSLNEVWKNTYYRYYHQESHSHPNSELSFVIFMNDYQENDAKFYFLNERNRVTSTTWLSLSEGMEDSIYVEPKKGDILFFPSHMIHGVTPHQSDIPRITISGNISLKNLGEENPN
jgi:hypothetical protein|tara:strand:+ start:168 stop:743 length:576 start_codon:yes stop_codon:yes gene_type:complete